MAMKQMIIDEALVCHLVATQFPQWKDLPIWPVAVGGWDNRTFDWDKPPVWVHGDISQGNLLVRNGQLCAVIDFGQLTVGDPACDLAITWTFFQGESRKIFRTFLALDANTWARGRAWTLWKALVIAAGITGGNAIEATQAWWIIKEVLTKHAGKSANR